MDHQNPISPALHPIPQNCPLCGEQQWPHGSASAGPMGSGIEDLNLSQDPDEDRWTVVHVDCKYIFRDEVVAELVRSSGGGEPNMVIHDAIRNAIRMDVLIAELGTDFFHKEQPSEDMDGGTFHEPDAEDAPPVATALGHAVESYDIPERFKAECLEKLHRVLESYA